MEGQADKFANGPIGERSITDCCCCILFIAGIFFFCAFSAYGWDNGDPNLLLVSWDSDQNGCGFNETTKDYPYLYWPEPPSADIKDAITSFDVSAALSMLNYGTCVKACPRADDTPIECSLTEYMLGEQGNDGKFDGCTFKITLSYFADFGFTDDMIADYMRKFDSVSGGLYWPYRYDTKPLYGFCIPDVEVDPDEAQGLSQELIDMFMELFEGTIMEDKVTSYARDIAYSWKVVAVCSGTAVFLGYLYLIIIRWIGGIIVWCSIFLL